MLVGRSTWRWQQCLGWLRWREELSRAALVGCKTEGRHIEQTVALFSFVWRFHIIGLSTCQTPVPSMIFAGAEDVVKFCRSRSLPCSERKMCVHLSVRERCKQGGCSPARPGSCSGRRWSDAHRLEPAARRLGVKASGCKPHVCFHLLVAPSGTGGPSWCWYWEQGAESSCPGRG